VKHNEVERFWEGNAEAWTRLARAGYDICRDGLNTPGFFAMLPMSKGWRASTSAAARDTILGR
jgi:hypothetical protein